MKGPGFWKHGGAWGGGSFHKNYTGSSRGPAAPNVDCPERGCEVCFSDCLRCQNFQVWEAKDDGLRRCYHEYMDLESRGYYDGTWEDHPENFDPETFERIQERKRLNEEINREMELERAGFEEREEELANNISLYEYNEYYEADEEEEPDDDQFDDEEEEFYA